MRCPTIQAEYEAVEHRERTGEKHIDAPFQLEQKLFIAPSRLPHFAGTVEQGLEFAVALGAAPVSIADRQPRPIEMPPLLLGVEQRFIAHHSGEKRCRKP